MPVFPERDCITMGRLADRVEAHVGTSAASRQTAEHGMNSDRQQTFTIIGSTVGTVLASTIAIATLIVTQHDAMRRSTDEQHTAIRTSTEQEHAALRASAEQEHAALRTAAKQEHAALRTVAEQEHAALRTAAEQEHAALRASAEQEHAALRGDIAEIHGDIRVIRSDISDLRERTARIEAHVGVMPENR